MCTSLAIIHNLSRRCDRRNESRPRIYWALSLRDGSTLRKYGRFENDNNMNVYTLATSLYTAIIIIIIILTQSHSRVRLVYRVIILSSGT